MSDGGKNSDKGESIDNKRGGQNRIRRVITIIFVVIIFIVIAATVYCKITKKCIDPTPTWTPTSFSPPISLATSQPTPTFMDNPAPTPTDAPILIPSDTPTPVLNSLILDLELVAQSCRRGFGRSDGYVMTELGCRQENPNGVQFGWNAPREGSYAGCTVELPPEMRSLSSYTYLTLLIQGNRGGEQFQIGLADSSGEHKERVEVPIGSEQGTVQIFLSRFEAEDINLDEVERMIFGFDYALGESARDGGMCIRDIEFVP